MPGITERHPSHSPRLTYFPWTSVTGGRMCEPDPDHPGYIRHASANSITAVGVAKHDAARKDGGPFEMSDRQTSGLIVNDFTPTEVVCYQDSVFDLYVNAAVAEGQRLVCGADGVLVPYNGTDNPARIVGKVVGKRLTAAGVTRVELRV